MTRRKPLLPIKRKLLKKQQFRCPQCDLLISWNRAELHHLTPLSEGGSNEESNLVVWCKSCHATHTRYLNTDAQIRDSKREWHQYMNSEEKRVFEFLKGKE